MFFNIFYLLGFFTPSSPLFKIDLLVQKDITFIMHRSVELWRTWYTEPMPNIGTYSYVRTRMRLLEFANIYFDHLFKVYLIIDSLFITLNLTFILTFDFILIIFFSFQLFISLSKDCYSYEEIK